MGLRFVAKRRGFPSVVSVAALASLSLQVPLAKGQGAAPSPAAQGSSASPQQTKDNGDTFARMGGNGGIDILSDTQGVDFNPYLHKALGLVYDQWVKNLPEEARPPKKLAGETLIRFTIAPDGQVLAMHLDGSTHEDSLNRAAWGAIANVGSFPALPEEFHGPNLELRIHFLVNEQSAGAR